MHLKALLIAASALLAPVASLQPQRSGSPPASAGIPLVRGSRVRVQATQLVTPLIANYIEFRNDTLVLVEDAGRGLWSLPLSEVQRLEASVGLRAMYRPYIVTGTVVGAGAGAVAGLLFASIASPSDSSRKYSRVLTGGIGAVIGAGVGALLGSRRKAEQFTTVPLPRRVTVLPNRGGVFVSISY